MQGTNAQLANHGSIQGSNSGLWTAAKHNLISSRMEFSNGESTDDDEVTGVSSFRSCIGFAPVSYFKSCADALKKTLDKKNKKIFERDKNLFSTDCPHRMASSDPHNRCSGCRLNFKNRARFLNSLVNKSTKKGSKSVDGCHDCKGVCKSTDKTYFDEVKVSKLIDNGIWFDSETSRWCSTKCFKTLSNIGELRCSFCQHIFAQRKLSKLFPKKKMAKKPLVAHASTPNRFLTEKQMLAKLNMIAVARRAFAAKIKRRDKKIMELKELLKKCLDSDNTRVESKKNIPVSDFLSLLQGLLDDEDETKVNFASMLLQNNSDSASNSACSNSDPTSPLTSSSSSSASSESPSENSPSLNKTEKQKLIENKFMKSPIAKQCIQQFMDTIKILLKRFHY